MKRFQSEFFQGKFKSVSIEQKELSLAQPFHWHDFYEIEYIIDGAGEYRINGAPAEIKKGMLFLSTPTDFQEIIFTRKTTLINISFISQVIDPSLLHELGNARTVFDETGYYDFMIGDIVRHERFESRHSMPYITHLLNALLISVLNAADGSDGRGECAADPFLKDTLPYIHTHFTEQISVSELARRVNLTPEYFSRKFRQSFGVTASRYISDIRIRHARAMIANSEETIGRIAYSCGFNSVEHFSRTFKKKYGCSPGRCRKLPKSSANG